MNNEWKTEPPTESEVGNFDGAWATNKRGEVVVNSGSWIRRHWFELLAWAPVQKPEAYEPPKMRREWQCVVSVSGYRGDRNFGNAWNETFEGITVREVLPCDPTPEAVDEVAESLSQFRELEVVNADVLRPLIKKLRGGE